MMIYCLDCYGVIEVLTYQNVTYQCLNCGTLIGPRSSDNEKIAYFKIYHKIKKIFKLLEKDFIKFNLEIQKQLNNDFNDQGFNSYGIYLQTGTEFNQFGYNRDGYDKFGYKKDGYDKFGYDKFGYDKFGYDKFSYNQFGYNEDGYDRGGYDKNGYNQFGYDKDGYDQFGYDKGGYNKDGYDKFGYNNRGIHSKTGTKLNPDGYDKYGFDENGFTKDGIHIHTRTRFNLHDFTKDGIHSKTGTEFNLHGFNRFRYNNRGIHSKTGTEFNLHGFNQYGFNNRGIHSKTGTEFNLHGFNQYGFNKNGLDADGYNQEGFDLDGYDKNGWNDFLRSLPLDSLISLERSPSFYKLYEKKQNISINSGYKEIHSIGPYCSKYRNAEIHYQDELTQTILRNKNENNGIIHAQKISKLMFEYLQYRGLGTFDCIIPVANHTKNSEQNAGAVSIAQELSKLLKIECLSNALEKTLNIKARTIPNNQKTEFWKNNNLYIFSGIHKIKNKRILLIDDIVTHGNTIDQCIYQLGYEAPKGITVLCAGRTTKKDDYC